ncbi:DUF411 domain-containing protein [Thiothrix eikelboomii]|uniref:Uncharacterized conserved protein n=1 Tax=Thiothrix eikelboomii TaxID=92487 RepID=A0A1T4W337_9GAMM|nr:DUF411 domain-containing protein [Thiothrix eikelboomii]SKA71478.1 Uncharacterized conserved protein [Thiothrix eikelboomii]
MKKQWTLALIALVGGWVSLSAISLKAETQSEPVLSTAKATQVLPVVQVYKSASCGCCKVWIKHLEENGFSVQAQDVDNLLPYKEQAKLGAGMGSCHTAFVDGYAIEGHVPAWDIKRLLLEKPPISGLTVPRMPIGSPGMEVAGRPADAYQVLSYKEGETVGVFADYPAGK